ncbi:hypothetical protein C7444_10737 [Sphaerotilus hippei]|uniref:Uncharacterized protein n=1 Tax=Sphaerotilus hippei TaxID=744406 RepID=A0A318H080_9BURK|nr:hypothetical protein C7444_10737 [Sphaerotilus hippei]
MPSSPLHHAPPDVMPDTSPLQHESLKARRARRAMQSRCDCGCEPAPAPVGPRGRLNTIARAARDASLQLGADARTHGRTHRRRTGR